MFRNATASLSFLALLFVSAGLARANDLPNARRPLGVYAKISIEDAIRGYPGPGVPSPAELHSYLRTLYADLLSNPAISGLTVGAHWDHIQLSDTIYDWSYLDDTFDAVAPGHKTIQLIITPGVDSPQWLLAGIPSCDGLFHQITVQPDCGTVRFEGFPEEQRADGKAIPLPWNSVYQNAWQNFLTHLNARYGSNPAFVSIAVAGPVVASDEMILPTNVNDSATQPSGLSVNDTWAALIQHSFPSTASYQNSDQVFIDQWKAAIDMYEGVFSGLTLFIGADSGNDLPRFARKVTPHPDNTLFAQDCADGIQGAIDDLMSCEAKTEILSYFVAVKGSNAKATQVGGMTASSPASPGDIGVPGVKLLTSLSPPPSPPFLGGAEFDYPVSESNNFQAEGCPDYPNVCPGLTVEEAAYHVLTIFFNGTPTAAHYGGTSGIAHMHYLEVPYVDVQYAIAHPSPPSPSPIIGSMSLQDLLNRASRDLMQTRSRAVRH